jgi:hypothetical protein
MGDKLAERMAQVISGEVSATTGLARVQRIVEAARAVEASSAGA